MSATEALAHEAQQQLERARRYMRHGRAAAAVTPLVEASRKLERARALDTDGAHLRLLRVVNIAAEHVEAELRSAVGILEAMEAA